MNKKIYFCLDFGSFGFADINSAFCKYYLLTSEAIECGEPSIYTLSIAHLSFDLLDKGYDIYLCYKDKQVKIEPGMELHLDGSPCKEIRRGHNLLKLFLGGTFNELLGIEK